MKTLRMFLCIFLLFLPTKFIYSEKYFAWAPTPIFFYLSNQYTISMNGKMCRVAVQSNIVQNLRESSPSRQPLTQNGWDGNRESEKLLTAVSVNIVSLILRDMYADNILLSKIYY
jgi:hypothetical protein